MRGGLVAVTGAGGHLGGNVVEVLLRRGYRVRAVVRRDRRAVEGCGCEVVEAEVLERGSLERAFEGADAVVHCAAYVSISGGHGGLVWRVNVEGVRNVLNAAARVGVWRVVHVSSIHAFRECGEVVDEKAPLVDGEGSVYDRSKAEGLRVAAEAAARGQDVVAVCPTGIIGPKDYKPSRMGRFFIALTRGRVPALVEGGFDWVDVRDVAEGVVAALERGRRGERYVLSGRYVKVAELARAWCGVAGVRAPRVVVPPGLARIGAGLGGILLPLLPGEPLFTAEAIRALSWRTPVSSERAHRRLGYVARPLEETLEDTYRWFKEYGYV
ncbi:NAD-dependent epimerase/dehydratase family protein [Spirochaeta thermophila]|uniref:NAD-dependent epimerase/dehydratase domain-containing protein n=1 Tax=Winmispira thermophila (strain ATCC 49972 / DSM 6192 / RI 19.B1) TaxID=665571 RepID=E0RNK2_WINT6|nr:NAD-dependent epimerase/dehydratase family protein [Spirochaeta thermophila]ADN02593.1 hypothetical protein STHERM_c16550 [Spirochaeta thermophila DSM 6192]